MKEVRIFSVDVSYKGRMTVIKVMAGNPRAAQEKARKQAKQEGLDPVSLSWPMLVEEYVLA